MHLYNCSVCYLAGKFARHLQVLQKDFEDQQQQQGTEDQHNDVQDIKISEKEEKCLRLAGLCHDLGW
jgi:HD superfamily phosphohydrolase